MLLYCSGMMYKYYSHIVFLSIKNNEEGKDIHERVFNNIPHSIKNIFHVNFNQGGFVMQNSKSFLQFFIL